MAQKVDRRKIAKLSRDTGFLVKLCVGLVLFSLVLSACLPLLKKSDKVRKDFDYLAAVTRNAPLMAFAKREPTDFRSLAIQPLADAEDSEMFDRLHDEIKESTMVEVEQKELLLLLVDGMHGSQAVRDTAVKRLLGLPAGTRFRNEFLGDVYINLEAPEKAIDAYIAEGEQFADANYSQISAVVALTERKETERLRELVSRNNFRKPLSGGDGVDVAKLLDDQPMLFAMIFKSQTAALKSYHVITAGFTAAIWFFILLSMGGFKRRDLGWGIAAFVMGMFSVVITIYLIYIQKDLNIVFHEEDTLVNQLIALVAGIGLREELAKLICYVPIAILTLRHRNVMLALITAGLTGLGFAMQENLQYFFRHQDQFVAWDRLLTANALHFCLTGIVGFSFYRLLLYKGRGWENFLIDFLFVVVIHGVYDGLLMIPMFQEYGIIALVILALVAYRYLDLVRSHMQPDGQLRKISPLGVFVVGAALLVCGIMVVTSLSNSFINSAGALATAVGGSIPIAFAFISRLRDL